MSEIWQKRELGTRVFENKRCLSGNDLQKLNAIEIKRLHWAYFKIRKPKSHLTPTP